MAHKKSLYLKLANKYNVIPNFWLSEEYLYHMDWSERIIEGYVYLLEVGTIVMFPPIHLYTGELLKEVAWCDFLHPIVPNARLDFLDWEYLYNPKAFLDMKGKKWSVFRKNSRKWNRTNPGASYIDLPLTYFDDAIQDLFYSWANRKWEASDNPELIQDNEVMIAFLFGARNRKRLFHNGELKGINVWDENYMFINFRYCISTDEPFLNEYMRLLFYTDEIILNKNKLVNDGGVLDNPLLEKFKDKLNPLYKRKVFSIKGDDDD